MTVRSYHHASDYEAVSRFLIEAYRAGELLGNWLQPRWEYLHFHPMSIGLPFERCGVAEAAGEIVGFVHFESHPAFNYLQIRPGQGHVAGVLIDWAESHLGGASETLGSSVLGIYVNDFDTNLERLATERGFELEARFTEEHARFVIEGPVPDPELPDGFRLQSLHDGNDFSKINQVLWRGFDHEGPPPDEGIPGRKLAQQAPNFRSDLTIVAVAPNGDYAAYAGMWVVGENRVGYVEPVATDPDYRRMGLGRAAVLETIRRAAAAGADVVWVGSGLEFYLNMGFTIQNRSRLWVRPLG